MTPDSALTLLRLAARVSPPLLEAVVLVEDRILRLEEALAWQVTMGHTTAAPPLSVQQTMNEIRVAAGETPWPLREPTPPLSSDGDGS